MSKPLGRRTPPDWDHVDKYRTLTTASPGLTVETKIKLPTWHKTHDQGSEGSCVGHGSSAERAITNSDQNVLLRVVRPSRRYDPIWLWNQAKIVDPFPDTNPGDDNGTLVRSAYDVLRDKGHVRVHAMNLVNGVPTPDYGTNNNGVPDLSAGASVNRWATTVDEVRQSLSQGIPVTIGVNWYEGFDSPIKSKWAGSRGFEYKIDISGKVRGGHCVCLYNASDKRQAVQIWNSWGAAYPQPWLSYENLQRLLSEDGEATQVVDR